MVCLPRRLRRLIRQRIPGDQPSRPAGALHDMVAGIDAQAAVDAFQLDAVADVDAGRARGHAGAAIDAITGMGVALPLASRSAVRRASPDR